MLQQKYRKSPEYMVNYSYTDIAAATGVQDFYGMNTLSDSQTSYSLTNVVAYSEDIFTGTAGAASTAFIKTMDKDFDVMFNLSQTINGDVIVQVPFGVTVNTTSTTATCYPNIKLIRYDGVTETQLAEASGGVVTKNSGGDSNVYNSAVTSIRLPVVNQTFKENDIFRITCELWEQGTPAKTYSVNLAHDPQNRAVAAQFGDAGVTKFVALVPFKLEI